MPNSERIETLISPEALKQFETLKASTDANTASFEKLIAKAVELNKAVGNATTFKEINKATQEMTEHDKALAKQITDLEKANAKLNAMYADEAKKLAEVKSQQQARNQAIKEEIQLNQAAEGSIKQKQILIKQLTKEYDNLSAAERESSKGQNLLKGIQQLDSELKSLEGTTGRFQRNVGNYTGSAKIIVDALERAREKVNSLSKAVDTTPAALARARSEFDALRQVTEGKQFLSFGGKMGDAQAEVKTFTRVLVNLETQGQGNSESAKELRQRLAELTDQIADTKAEVKALASDTRTFDLFASSISFAADVFQTAAGAAVAFGASEKDAAEAAKTLLAIQTVANGVKGIANELTTRGTAANKLYTFSQMQLSTAMDSTATAGARLKGALITLGIGAVIIGIGLLIANFDKIKRSISGVSKEQEALNDVMKESGGEYVQAVKLISQLKANIDLAKQGIIQKEAVIKSYNDSLGKTTGQVKSLEQAEKELIEKGDAYIQMTLKKAVANIALEKAAQKAFEAEEAKRKKDEEFGNAVTVFNEANARAAGLTEEEITALKTEELQKRKKAVIDAKNAEQKVYIDIANDAQKAMAEISKAFNLNPLGNNTTVQQTAQTKKFRDGVLKDDADLYKKLSDNQDAYLTTRLAAREKAFQIEKQILNGQRDAEVDNLIAQLKIDRDRASIGEISKEELAQKEQDFINKKREINGDYSEKQILLERNTSRDLLAIRQSFIVRQRELLEQDKALFVDDSGKELNTLKSALDKRVAFLSQGRDIEFTALENKRAQGLIKEEDYQRERLRIENSYAALLIKAEIEYTESVLKLAKSRGEDTATAEAQLAALKLKYTQAANAKIIADNILTHEKEKELLEQKKQLYKDLGSQIIDTFNAIIVSGYDRQISAIQSQIDKLEEQKQKDIEVANATIANKDLRETEIAKIEVRAQAQRDLLEQRQRGIEIQKAKFEKMSALLKVTVDTVQKVAAIKAQAALLAANPLTALLAPLALSQLPLVIASGALAAGVIAAAPLPKYEHGTSDAQGGLSLVGEKRKELIITPDGNVTQTPSRPTVMNVPKHSIVLPDARAALESGLMVNRHGRLVQAPDNGIQEVGRKIDTLTKVMKNKPVLNMSADQGGLTAMWQYGANWVKYVEEQTKF